MERRPNVDIFVEDRAHEELLKPLLVRVCREEGFDVSLQVRTGRGGHARALNEFNIYQAVIEKGVLGWKAPDLLVVAIDGNCTTFSRMKSRIADSAWGEFRHMLVSACPDPHVERWFLADPDSFHTVVGYRPDVGPAKCERNHYKRILRDSVARGGHPPTLDGIEFASELVGKMDLYRAGRRDPSLKSFLDDLRSRLRGIQRDGGPDRASDG